jgi:hypothetical protein
MDRSSVCFDQKGHIVLHMSTEPQTSTGGLKICVIEKMNHSAIITRDGFRSSKHGHYFPAMESLWTDAVWF